MTILDFFTLAERGGLYATAAVTIIIVQMIKQSKIKNRYMPLISLLIGFSTGIVIAYFGDTSIFIGSIDGIVAGAVASGVFDSVKSIYDTIFDKEDV